MNAEKVYGVDKHESTDLAVKRVKSPYMSIVVFPYTMVAMKKEQRIIGFTKEIWQWYEHHKRVLPWRDLHIQDEKERMYHILVSEIMLQQTQVERVKIVFNNFLELFPKIEDLASANNAEVIQAWRGMGYNNRALRLRDAARVITGSGSGSGSGTNPDPDPGSFTSMTYLQSLPGVGHYTAAAIRNFAFNLPTACLDTNIRRILHRTFVGPEKSDGTWEKDDTHLLDLAQEVLNEALSDGDTANWHAALMDFGSLVCTSRNPKWEVCPLTAKNLCKASYKVPELKVQKKKEPGRTMGTQYIPNRIFRGRIVEQLRDAPSGLPSGKIGEQICIDWSEEHNAWLQSLLKDLIRDRLIQKSGQKYTLAT